MSGSETGVLNSGANIGLQKSPAAPPQPVIQSMHLSFGTDGNPMYKPVTGNGNGNGSEGMNINMGMAVGEPGKKKRGRPRKYVPEGSIAVPISSVPPGAFSSPPQPPPQPPPQHHPPPPPPPQHQSPPPQHQTQPLQQPPPQKLQQHQTQPAQPPPPPQPPQSAAAATAAGSPTSMKKARGRPPGAGRKSQLEAVGSLGIGFTPHVITVNSGEDVASRIMSFSQTGPRAVCILSAIGALSNVTLRQAATSGGSVTYEGRFEILSLSGSFMLTDGCGPRSRTGGLSVSLAGPDGRVLGGGVAGLLIAASPVQVVVGSFISDNRREPKTGNLTEPPYASAKSYPATGQTGPSSPPSRGTLSESSGGGPGSPLNQSTGAVNSTPISMSSLPWK